MSIRALALGLLIFSAGCHNEAEATKKEGHHGDIRTTGATTTTPQQPLAVKRPPTVHAVPIGTSPVRGKSDALVTVVEFDEFQCPYCQNAQATIATLREQYGDDLRVVWKNLPLAIHARAKPAAELALEAREEKGDATFWLVHDALFELGPKTLDDAALLSTARNVGLSEARVKSALASMKHQHVLDEDTALANKLGVDAAPIFFINGQVLVGAETVETFRGLIDRELAKAKARVTATVPRGKVYDAIMTEAVDMPIGP